jgi:predicted nuclease of predicted toxin-antitoxin system
MRFLADESCDIAIVKALRDAGHDALRVADLSPGAEDLFVIDLAHRERRILLTEDKDFGQLVYAHGQRTAGVIFLRYPFFTRQEISKQLVQLVLQHSDKLSGAFVTIQIGRTRISRISAN